MCESFCAYNLGVGIWNNVLGNCILFQIMKKKTILSSAYLCVATINHTMLMGSIHSVRIRVPHTILPVSEGNFHTGISQWMDYQYQGLLHR